jgi:signal transduction histidine kinase
VALGTPVSRGSAVAQEPRKSILVLLPDQPGLPGAMLGLAGIRDTIVATWGTGVSIYPEHVDLERFPGTDHEHRLRDGLHAKYAGMTLDGIVTFGPTPLRFLIRWAPDLWPGVPAVTAAVDELLLTRVELPPGVTAIPMRYDVEATVRLALRLLPGARRVALSSGVSPMDLHFEDMHRQQLEVFGDRLELIDLTGLSLEELLKRVAALPDDTILLLAGISVDGAGRSFLGVEILPRITAAASRPAFSVFGPTLGRGVVGGSMVDFREVGAEAARALARILGGKVGVASGAADTANRLLVDWRQLRRWGLDESRLPSGTQVLHREPTLWEQYRWAIVSALGLLVSQTLVVAALLFERRRRQRAQTALEDRLRFETALAEISAGFADVSRGARPEPGLEPPGPAGPVDHQVREGLRRVAEVLGAERASLWRFSKHGGPEAGAVSWTREGLGTRPGSVALDDLPFMRTSLMRGEPLRVRSLDELPPEASADRRSLARDGVRSLVAVPLEIDGTAAGAIACMSSGRERAWPDDVGQRLRTVGEIFASALARTEAESALRRSEALNRAVLASLPSELAVIDGDGVIVHVNEGWTAFARENGGEGDPGLSVGANYLEVCRRAVLGSDRTAGRALQLIESVLRGGSEGETLEYFGGRPGEDRWFEMQVRRLGHAGGEAVIVHRDITERKRAEDEARRTLGTMAHLERVAAVGELASALAHELNQPLTAILANAQTAEEWLATPSPDLAEVRDTVHDIVVENIRASEVIRRMRGMLKKGELRSDAVDLNEVVREVTRLIANDALLRGASIDLDLAPALSRVRGDPIQFQQVLLNLLVNGLHAVADEPPHRRRLIVRTARVDGGVEVSVQDTGKGIAESDLSQVFAPFFSTKGEGLGVGLSISRSIVETYGGRIQAENDPDGGAIFRVRLPTGAPQPGSPGHAADLPR